MKVTSSFIFLFFMASIVTAQSTTAEIFKKTTQRINSLNSIGYSISFMEKNPFSKGDISEGVTNEDILLNPDRTIKYKITETNLNSGQSIFRETYLAGKLYSINLTDSTYVVNVPKSPVSYHMADISTMMESEFKAHSSKIFHKKDTLFNGKKCYNFLIKSYDMISNGNHDYTHKQILIDQKTLLPLYLKSTGAGSAYKEGLSLGRLDFYTENIFYNFVADKKIKIMPFVNSGFSLPNTEMLKDGERAPELSLNSLSGLHVPEDSFTGKLLLVVFGGTACPANPLANPMLNRLHSKFSSADFSIINIYTNETTEQVQKYIESNSLNFPVYLGNRS
ncbi:redoxin domain-containing protein [Pedobacter sp. CG_S7]|uniref:TlpA family protein disulfide reductase n=1 Tax=Pedobacter sp. CG_S7 TaxID=3143930 RepID=UPI003394F39F